MHSSTLESPGQRFLSIFLAEALATEWLTPADFVRAFSPLDLMAALEDAGELRARLLVEACGVHEKIAPKKSTSAATEDLTIALNEGVANAELLLEIVNVDARVRYLSPAALWNLATESSFWNESSVRSRARMRALLETALEQELLSLAEIIIGVSPSRLAGFLPKALLENALVRAIEAGQTGSPFDATSVFEAIPLDQWTEHVPLPVLWDEVVLGLVVPKSGLPLGVTPKPVAPATRREEAPVHAEKSPKKAKKESEKPAIPREEAEARQRALDNLARIERVPVRPESLSTALLLAIDSMYADLLATSSDEERTEAILEAFPNKPMMEEALFAIVEALDPRLTPETLRARGAEGDSLITLVLFEERRRSSGRTSTDSVRQPSRPPGPVAQNPSSVPPPASTAVARSSGVVPPPLPGDAGPRKSIPPPPLPAQAKR